MKVATKFITSLTKKEKETLEKLNKNGSTPRIRMRAHSILLSFKNLSINEIAEIYSVNRDTVSSWLKSWEKFGVQGLKDKSRPGAPSKLTEDDKKILEKLISQHPSSPKTVLAMFTEQTKKTISSSTLKRFSKSLELSWKRVRKSSKPNRNKKNLTKPKKN